MAAREECCPEKCCGDRVGTSKACLGSGCMSLAISGACTVWGVLFCLAWLGEEPNTEFFAEYNRKKRTAKMNHTNTYSQGFDDVWNSEFEHNWLQAWYFNPYSATALLLFCALPCCVVGPIAIVCAHTKLQAQIAGGRVDTVGSNALGRHAASPFSKAVAAFGIGNWITGCSIVTGCCGFCFLTMSLGPLGYFFIRVVFFGLPTGLIMLCCCAVPLGVSGGLFVWRAAARISTARAELAYSTHDASGVNRRAIDDLPIAEVLALSPEPSYANIRQTGGSDYSAPILPEDSLGVPMLGGGHEQHEQLEVM